MQIKLDNFKKFTTIIILAFILAGCSSGSKSSGESNTTPTPTPTPTLTPTPSPTPTVNPSAYSLGNLPNGSVVYISESSFSVNHGEITSGTISISGGESSDASYQLNFSISPINGPTQSSNPNPCIVAPKGNTSCAIIFNSANVNNGTYTITVSYTSETIAQISHTSKTNTKITASQEVTLPNTATIIVTGLPPVVESGRIEILPPAKTNINRLESTTLTVSLSDSQNITTPVNITVSATNSDIVTLHESTCNLTTMNNTCNISISGKYQGSTSFNTTASGYQSATSASLKVKPIIAYITSGLNDKILQCSLGESGIESTTCAAVTENNGNPLTGLNNPIGIASYNGFIYITNSASNAYMQCKTTGIGRDFTECKKVQITASPSLYNITINNNFAYFTHFTGNKYTRCGINTDGIESNSCSVSNSLPSYNFSSIAFAGSYAYIVSYAESKYNYCNVTDNMIINNSCQPQTPPNDALNKSLGMVINNNFAYFTNFNDNTYAQCSVVENGLINLNSCSKINTITNKLDYPNGIAVSNDFVYIINSGLSKSYTQCRVDSDGINAGSCTQTSLDQLLNNANSITLY